MIQIYQKITDHFQWEDFECPCCGELYLTKRFYRHITFLETIREEVGWPIGVNSGHRCKRHNLAVSGEEKSQHLVFATDVTPIFEEKDTDITWEAKRSDLYGHGIKLFDGVGIYNWGVHFDLRGFPAKWDRRTIA